MAASDTAADPVNGKPCINLCQSIWGGCLQANVALLSRNRSLQLAIDCARGMAYLHNKEPMSIIHRDLKPANIMIGGFNMRSARQRQAFIQELGILKIADFGLAKSLKLQQVGS
jgi:serine/threonine protein kinase